MPVSTVQRSDFDLKPFMVSSDLVATWQILSVLLPYAALWFAAYHVHDTLPWLLVPIAGLMVLFLSRSFALMHDCGHYSLFRRARVNRAVGFLLGIVNGLPQYPWSRGHAYHHKNNGNWERYRGPAAVLSVAQFDALSPFRQGLYTTLRHPLMLFPGGLFYLVVKPRVQLLCGLLAYVPHLLACLWRFEWRRMFTYQSKFWYTTGEFWDLLFNNICVVGAWIVCGELMGHGFFWALYAAMMMVTAAIFICVFYIQHNFAESYAHRDEGWSYLAGALEGSSYFKLPGILNWFTADIGYHNVHHLCERIPNYRLAACHRANAHLLADVKVLRIRDIPTCCGYILWDAAHDRLLTVAEHRRQSSISVVTAARSYTPTEAGDAAR
ncbi:MAG: fatty acid desaturase [Planctomycetes bacterium]|nr:fatty acid desaturase [Planctomycetota bacterium]